MIFFQNFGDPSIFKGLGFDANFGNDEDILKVVINAKGAFAIKPIQGPNIEEIHISGQMLEIPTVCPFLRTEDDLPSLNKLEFSNIGIDNFQAIQDCGNDSFTAPNQKTNKVEVNVGIICHNNELSLSFLTKCNQMYEN